MEQDFEIFITFKNTDEEGNVTNDFYVAEQLYKALTDTGFKTFFSPVTIHNYGASAYKKFIDAALDSATMMIVVATSLDNMMSTWVEYEWNSFDNDILSGIKPNGQIVSVVYNIKPLDMPRSLRFREVFDIAKGITSQHIVSFVINYFKMIGKTPPVKPINQKTEQLPERQTKSKPINDTPYYIKPDNKKDEGAIDQLKKTAEQGNVDDMIRLGEYYLNHDTDPERRETVKWFERAAIKGSLEAQLRLADIYYNGKGPEVDYKKAMKWYEAAAEQRNSDAMVQIGLMYLRGKGVEKSDEEAFKWVTKAAELGHGGAQFYLGYAFLEGNGVQQSYEEAYKWFMKSARLRNEGAQFYLGVMYDRGLGVQQSYEEAYKWFMKAAEQGDGTAQTNVGLMYGKGQGVQQSYEEAYKWFMKAAEQGYAEAQYSLGSMYADAKGVSRSYIDAYKWFMKAAEQGHAGAQFSLGILYSRGLGVKQSDEEATKWIIKAAEQGHPNAVEIINQVRNRKETPPE